MAAEEVIWNSSLPLRWEQGECSINLIYGVETYCGSLQIDDFESATKRRRFSGRFYEVAFHDNAHLGRVSTRHVDFRGQFVLSRKNRVSVSLFAGELQFRDASNRPLQRMVFNVARHQRTPLHRTVGARSAFEASNRQESSRGSRKNLKSSFVSLPFPCKKEIPFR